MVARLYQYEMTTQIPQYPSRKGLILQWNQGWGEISPLPGLSQETFEEARDEILHLLPHLEMAKPSLPSVRFGLSSASAPFPIIPIRIPLCALNREAPGFKTVKLKLGHLSLDAAVALVKQYQGKYRLRVDCNGVWTLRQALSFAAHFKSGDFEYLEDPIGNFSDLVRFSETTHFPIAVDKSLASLPIQEIPTLKAIVVKPTVIGAIPTPPPNVQLILSSSYETGLGLLHIARLAQKLSLDLPIGLDTVRLLNTDFLTSPIDTSSGFFSWKPRSSYPIDISKLCLLASAP